MQRENRHRWLRSDTLLMLMAAAVPISFAARQALLNNLAIEMASFTGRNIWASRSSQP